MERHLYGVYSQLHATRSSNTIRITNMTVDSIYVNLDELIHANINTAIPKPLLAQALAEPPFVPIPGVINIRDLGASPNSPIRRNMLYRSGTLHNLSASSVATLKDQLDIKMILDLRSESEVARSPDPVIEGVKNMYFESLSVPRAVSIERFVEEGGKMGYVEIYEEVLEIHKPSIQAALEWVRDEGTPILFHCTGTSLAPLL